jgi:hypothetical protein
MGTSYLNRAQDPESILEHASFDISRRFANTCSIFRSFLDHFDGYFVRKFGKDSTKHREWKRVLAAEYDASIAYRVVYVMRNYIQHYDMPPLSLSVAESAEEEGCTIRADVQVAPLLRDAYVRNKLSASSINCEHLSLLHLLNDWSECFTRILNFAESIRIQDALPAAQLIGSIRGALQIDNHGRLALSRVPEVKIRPTKLDLSLNWLPEQQAHSIIERARAT